MATLLMSDRLKYTDSVFRAGTAPDRDSAAMVIAKTVSTEAPANLLSWVWTLDPIRQRHVMSAMPFTDRHVIVAYLNEMSRPEHDDDKRRAVLTGMFQSRAHFQVISWIGVQSRDVAVKTMRLYRDAGGDLAELGNWLAGAGALLKAGGAVGAATDGFLSNLANSVGGALHSAATTVADGLGAAAGEVVDLFSTLKEAVSTVLDAMGKSAADFAAAMGSALSKGADYVEGVVNAVLNAGKKVGQLLSAVATLADTAVTALLDYLVNKLSNGFKLVIAWIADQASAVAKRFYGFVKALGKRVREMLGAIYEKGGQLIRKFVATIVAFGEDFVSILKEAAAAARRVFYAVEKWLATQAAPFIEKIIRMLHELGEIAVLAILCIVNAGRYLIPLYLVAKEIPMAYPGWTSKTDITQVPGLNVLRVSSTLKYVIFSDLHRGGSVDNALHVERAHLNQDLYVKALNRYFDAGYTLIENGDCEDLWNHAVKFALWLTNGGALFDASDTDTAVNLQALREILSLHKPTYDVIAKFHAAGRYIKVRGNHDAAMKRPEMLAELGRVLGKPIQVFDAVLIGSGPASSGGTSAHSGTGVHLPRIGTVPGAIPVIENLHLGDLGHVAAAASLGGTSGSSGKPANDILVIHGNQVDFFNAEEHNFLGKVLVACASLPVQSTDYQAIVDESSNASFTPESVRQVLAGTLPAFTNPEWKNHITKDKPVFNSLYEGASLPLFPDKPLTEIPMHSLSQHFNVSIVMGHTHDAKLITVDANSKRVFANSGTEGMWEGALSCVEIGGDTMKVVYHLPPSDSAGKDLLSTYFHASSSQLLDDSEVIETKSTS